jgi:hypothetical protein
MGLTKPWTVQSIEQNRARATDYGVRRTRARSSLPVLLRNQSLAEQEAQIGTLRITLQTLRTIGITTARRSNAAFALFSNGTLRKNKPDTGGASSP